MPGRLVRSATPIADGKWPHGMRGLAAARSSRSPGETGSVDGSGDGSARHYLDIMARCQIARGSLRDWRCLWSPRVITPVAAR
jgi:hypothetical protein